MFFSCVCYFCSYVFLNIFFFISFYFIIIILSFSVQHSGSSHGVESALLIKVELSKSIKVIIKKKKLWTQTFEQ